MAYRIVTCSEAGGHRFNEDSFEIRTHPDDSSCSVCVIADGQGGRSGGREASRIACRVAVETALTYPSDQLARPATWPTILAAAAAAVRDSPEAGFTTLVVLCVTGGAVCGASSGDSTAMVRNADGELHELTAHQRKNPPVGSGAVDFVPFAALLTAPWLVLMMSDGVWKYAGWDAISSAARLQDGEEIVESLKSSARLPGSGEFQDDCTVVAIQPRGENWLIP